MRGKVITIVLLVSILGTSICNATLVAHWKMDGDATDSEGTNNGTLNGDTYFGPGIIGQAGYFDGNGDSIYYGDILDSDIDTAFTIGAWIKLSEGALQKTLNYIFWKSDDSPGMRVTSGGKIRFVHWHKVGHGFGSTQVIEEEKWYHVAYVFDGSVFTGYINAEYTGGISDNGYSPGGYLMIGGEAGSEHSFKGLIDDVRIYDHALSQQEIADLVPEPASVLLLSLGAVMLRKRKA